MGRTSTKPKARSRKEELTAPFPYFGGKARIAELVWSRLGNVRTYIEPFAGSMSVLLRRPHTPMYEIANDKSGEVVNVWRAIAYFPKETARLCNWPRTEVDVLTRKAWYRDRLPTLLPLLLTGSKACDPEMAACWIWGNSTVIGHNWQYSTQAALPTFPYGRGVHRILPEKGLIAAGTPAAEISLAVAAGECDRLENFLQDWFRKLADRLRKVTLPCGDWKRVVTKSSLNHPPVGILFDPPYASHEEVYHQDSSAVAPAVEKWAQEFGENPELRIAICGYEGDYQLEGWQSVAWKAKGGYGSHDGENANAGRERVWFSPHCLQAETANTLLPLQQELAAV